MSKYLVVGYTELWELKYYRKNDLLKRCRDSKALVNKWLKIKCLIYSHAFFCTNIPVKLTDREGAVRKINCS